MWLTELIFFCAIVLQDITYSGRLIGAHNAYDGEFPHQVAILIWIPNYTTFLDFCGGSIIRKKWILTAAICQRENATYYIRAGSTRYTTPKQNFSSKIFIPHPEYKGENYSQFDIALIHLEKGDEFKWDKYVQAINLPKTNETTPHEMGGTLVGWGYTEHENNIQGDLRTVYVPIYNLQTCKSKFQNFPETLKKLGDNHICTGYLSGTPVSSGCYGDDGGPLIVLRNGSPLLIGIVSGYPEPCGSAPTVHIRVSAHVVFIWETAWEFEKKGNAVLGEDADIDICT